MCGSFFGQAKRMASQASNQHANNALFIMLVQLQAQDLSPFKYSRGKHRYLWQHHMYLPIIALWIHNFGSETTSNPDYPLEVNQHLPVGKGKWWDSDEIIILFMTEHITHIYTQKSTSPKRLSNHTIQQAVQEKEVYWQTDGRTELPTPLLRLKKI